MPTTNERAILATLAYFDLFSYPLTALEVWKWLQCDHQNEAPEFREILHLLHTSQFLRERVEEREGYYCLHGRTSCVAVRKERHLLADRKYERVRRAMRLLRFLPFLRGIAVCNSLAYANARDESDIDLLVIAAPGRLWSARLFATGLAALLRWRPTSTKTRDTICLSFYLAGTPTLKHLALNGSDHYLCYWLDTLLPVYGDAQLFDDLRRQNAWYRDHLPSAYGATSSWRRLVSDSGWSRAVKRTLEVILGHGRGDSFETLARRFQHRRLPNTLRRLANKDTRVIVNDKMLKFHENDRRAEFTRRHKLRLQEALGP